jgi:ubiquinone/menaquinone biosynthesis C-methylase UbiE
MRKVYDPLGVKHQTFFYKNYEQSNYVSCAGSAVRGYQRQILKNIPLRSDIDLKYLEVGALSLELSHQLFTSEARGQVSLVALDLLSPSTLGLNRRKDLLAKNVTVEFAQGDMGKLPFRDDAFDVIFHGCVLHHLQSPSASLTEMRRVLRRGGSAIYYLPCDPGWLIRVAQKLVTKRQVRKVISPQGFDVDYLWAIEHHNHYTSLREMILHVHQLDVVKVKSYPVASPFWNLKLFDIYIVKKQ